MGSTLDLLLCEECEEALDLIDPGRRRRSEMAVPAWPFGKPVADQLGLVARRVVHDDVNVEVSWHILFDGVEEPAELLRPVPRHALADNGPGLHVQRGEQRG